MQAFLANLTAACVALHAILGCCAHHGHAGETGHHETAAICASEHSLHVFSTAVSSCSCTDDSDADHATHPCSVSDCISVKPTENDLSHLSLEISAWLALEQVSEFAAWEHLSSPAETLSPPLSLYLLHQTLLI